MKLFRVAALVAVLFTTVSAQAQVLDLPRRPVRPRRVTPPDPTRTQQHLTLGLDALGSYDDNLAPDSGDALPEFAERPDGYTGLAIARVAYLAEKDGRVFDLGGRSYMNTYSNIGLTPSYGGNLNLRVRTPLGRQAGLEARQVVSYDPFFALGSFSVLPSDAGAGMFDSNPTTGVEATRSRMTDTEVLFDQRWRRDVLRVDYRYGQRKYEERVGSDSRTHGGGVTYDWSVTRSTAVVSSYRHTDVNSLTLAGDNRSYQDHTGELGFRYNRNLSPTRRLSFSGGGGGLYVETINDVTRQPVSYWTPSAFGAAQLDIGRSWAVNGNFRRGVSMLQGITLQPFVTNAANVGVGGFVTPKTDFTFTAGTSTGLANSFGNTGEFANYTAIGQLRIAMTRWSSAIVSYTRYWYDLNEAASRALGLSRNMNRNTVRVGFSLNLPLVGGDQLATR